MQSIKKMVSAISAFGVLTYVFFASKDILTKVVVVPFGVFSLAFFLRSLFVMLKKKKLADITGKVYVMAFAVYLVGFVAFWVYRNLADGAYLQALLALPVLIGGGYIICKRFKK